MGGCGGLVHDACSVPSFESARLWPRGTPSTDLARQLDDFSKIELRVFARRRAKTPAREIPGDGNSRRAIDPLAESSIATRTLTPFDRVSTRSPRPAEASSGLQVGQLRKTAPDDVTDGRGRPGSTHPKRDCLDRTSPLARCSFAIASQAASCSRVKGHRRVHRPARPRQRASTERYAPLGFCQAERVGNRFDRAPGNAVARVSSPELQQKSRLPARHLCSLTTDLAEAARFRAPDFLAETGRREETDRDLGIDAVGAFADMLASKRAV